MNKFPKRQPCNVDPKGDDVIVSLCIIPKTGYTPGRWTGNYNPPKGVGDWDATFFVSDKKGWSESEIVFYTKCRASGILELKYDLKDDNSSIEGRFCVTDALGDHWYTINDDEGVIKHQMGHNPACCCDSIYVYADMDIEVGDPTGNPPFMGCSWEFP